MKNSKLIAIDIDGTLLDDSKMLPPENREALEEAVRGGSVVAIASGRMTPTIEPIQDLLGIDCVLIAYNGAKVVGRRASGRPTIFYRPVPADVAEYVIELARDRGHLLNFYHEDRLYAEDRPETRPFRELYQSRTGARYQTEDLRRFAGTCPAKLILVDRPEVCDRLREELRPVLDGRAVLTKSEREYLEILAPGVDKGAALERIALYERIPMRETYGIGDAENDVELVRRAGFGIAVANAISDVKRVAKAVTERTNNEGAVAEALRRWVLPGAPEAARAPRS